MLWTFVKNCKISLHKGYMRLEYMMYTGGMRNQQILRYDIMICEEYIGGINMKKTWLALLLAMVMLASVFTGCTSKPAEKPAEPAASTVTEAPKEEPKPTEAPKEEPKPTEEPAPEPTEEPAPVEEPAAEGIHQISILNTLVMDMEAVKSEETRFNSYQLPPIILAKSQKRTSGSFLKTPHKKSLLWLLTLTAIRMTEPIPMSLCA